MLEKYRANIAELAPEDISCVLENLQREGYSHPRPILKEGGPTLKGIKPEDPETLYEWAAAHEIGHHDLVAVVAHDTSVVAFNVVEKLLGKPIERVHPKIPKTVIKAVKGNMDATIVQDHRRIRILVEGNPKRRDAARRFAMYQNGMTVSEYYAIGGRRTDVIWDMGRGWIELLESADYDARMR